MTKMVTIKFYLQKFMYVTIDEVDLQSKQEKHSLEEYKVKLIISILMLLFIPIIIQFNSFH